ncbi:MAG TPA: hypothetical protein EYQ75_24190 [Planctomycetaceae bacterium]|nr:hypothetical protein [Planctomycetaceae bacterium]
MLLRSIPPSSGSFQFLVALVGLCLPFQISAAEPAPQVKVTQPGVKLELVAEHPTLVTPTGIDVDSAGRVWLISSHTHFRPDDYDGPDHDEIVVLSNFKRDGKAETRHVFYNQTDATMDLELGADGWVYLAERDRILRVRDSDGDGVGDIEQVLAELTTEADYPHNGLSGLTWHPTGDLIFGLGENFAKKWTLQTPHDDSITGVGEGGIFRCRPDGSQLRRVARGVWNPFAVCVRADGQIFATDNDPGERPPCRLLHVVPGGDFGYQRSYGPNAHHPFVGWNGELRGTLPMVHPTGEAPCGIAAAGGGLIISSWSDHRIDYFALKPAGASFKAERIALVKGGRYFRPVCLARDHSATREDRMVWYFTDWVDGRYQLHKRGRLWRLTVSPQTATWWTTEKEGELSELGRKSQAILTGAKQASRKQLWALAKSEDHYVAHSAIIALRSFVDTWKPSELNSWSAADRLTALLVLKSATDVYQLDERSTDANLWLSRFLADSDARVRFEALRWVADASLNDYSDRVDKILTEPTIDYDVFEAAIAAKNSLSGKAELGLRNEKELLKRVRDPETSPRVRAFALRLLPVFPTRAAKGDTPAARRLPPSLGVAELAQLLEVKESRLRLEVVRFAAADPNVGNTLLLDIANNRRWSVRLRAEAIAGLSPLASQHLAHYLEWSSSSDRPIREAALQGLRAIPLTDDVSTQLAASRKKYADSVDLIDAILKPDLLKQQRPLRTDTQAWLAKLDQVSGEPDPVAGGRLFHYAAYAACSRCHRHEGRGTVVGPDLSHPRKDRRWLLESILQPSAEMAPEYRPRMMVLVDGRVITGIRLRSSTSEVVRDSKGQNQSFPRGDIESMQELNTSFMPDGLSDLLTYRELRDLLAFLMR